MEYLLSCRHIDENLASTYLQNNNLTFADLYKNPESLYKHTANMKPQNRQIINLPEDCFLEAELFGTNLVGYDGNTTLKPNTIKYEQKLPPFNAENPRLQTIMEALALFKQHGKTPCLNISGFASVFDSLYGSTLFYTEWMKNKAYLAELFAYMTDCYLQIINTANQNGVYIFSYAEPNLQLNMVGKRFAADYTQAVLLPFFEKLQKSNNKGILHICRLTTGFLVQNPNIQLQNHQLPQEITTDQMLTELSENTDKIQIIGNNCLNTVKKTDHYTEITLL